jgi:hypothetical protein
LVEQRNKAMHEQVRTLMAANEKEGMDMCEMKRKVPRYGDTF